jgi:hypothetical protein
MAVKTYDPKNISIIFAGKIITGFGDGTFVMVERNEQAFNLKVGVDGEGARAKNNNRSGKITLTLMQTSKSNDDLMALTEADELGNAGTGPFYMKDHSGSTLVGCLTAWVQKVPNIEDAKEVSMRTWVLESDELNMFVGGNK